jgi:hypothetical protein
MPKHAISKSREVRHRHWIFIDFLSVIGFDMGFLQKAPDGVFFVLPSPRNAQKRDVTQKNEEEVALNFGAMPVVFSNSPCQDNA